jgi:hypothetical protein
MGSFVEVKVSPDKMGDKKELCQSSGIGIPRCVVAHCVLEEPADMPVRAPGSMAFESHGDERLFWQSIRCRKGSARTACIHRALVWAPFRTGSSCSACSPGEPSVSCEIDDCPCVTCAEGLSPEPMDISDLQRRRSKVRLTCGCVWKSCLCVLCC